MTDANQHTTGTQGNGAALIAQVWKSLPTLIILALKPKELPTFPNSSSFVIYCYCSLLSISEASHTAQNTLYVEKYLLHLVRGSIPPTSSSLDMEVLWSALLDQKMHQQKTPTETLEIFQGFSSRCDMNCACSWRGQDPKISLAVGQALHSKTFLFVTLDNHRRN